MKLFQINLTRDEVNEINRAVDPFSIPKYKAYSDAQCFGRFPGRDFYEHVADLATADLEEAFHIGNMGPEERITRRARMHSVSVGDVLVTEAGDAFIVMACGFAPVAGWTN